MDGTALLLSFLPSISSVPPTQCPHVKAGRRGSLPVAQPPLRGVGACHPTISSEPHMLPRLFLRGWPVTTCIHISGAWVENDLSEPRVITSNIIACKALSPGGTMGAKHQGLCPGWVPSGHRLDIP